MRKRSNESIELGQRISDKYRCLFKIVFYSRGNKFTMHARANRTSVHIH